MRVPARRAQSPASPGCGPGPANGGGWPLPTGLITLTYAASGGRIQVTVAGELDLDTGDRLSMDVQAALDGSVTGVDLDLSGLDFCDCAGLNVLLDLRLHALRQGKTLVIQTSSYAVDRLLGLTDTSPLFAPAPDPTGSPCQLTRLPPH